MKGEELKKAIVKLKPPGFVRVKSPYDDTMTLEAYDVKPGDHLVWCEIRERWVMASDEVLTCRVDGIRSIQCPEHGTERLKSRVMDCRQFHGLVEKVYCSKCRNGLNVNLTIRVVDEKEEVWN